MTIFGPEVNVFDMNRRPLRNTKGGTTRARRRCSVSARILIVQVMKRGKWADPCLLTGRQAPNPHRQRRNQSRPTGRLGGRLGSSCVPTDNKWQLSPGNMPQCSDTSDQFPCLESSMLSSQHTPAHPAFHSPPLPADMHCS